MVNIQTSDTYTSTVEKGISQFFPGKKGAIGTLHSYHVDGLGTYQGLIPEGDSFNLTLLVEANGGASKTKLYIYLTAKQVN